MTASGKCSRRCDLARKALLVVETDVAFDQRHSGMDPRRVERSTPVLASDPAAPVVERVKKLDLSWTNSAKSKPMTRSSNVGTPEALVHPTAAGTNNRSQNSDSTPYCAHKQQS